MLHGGIEHFITAVQLELEHFATLHMRSRKFPSRACFAEISRILTLLSGIAARQISSSVLTIQVCLACQAITELLSTVDNQDASIKPTAVGGKHTAHNQHHLKRLC